MSAAHSIIGASSASRWMKCPGSVRLSADIPESTSPYAEEGTDAHAIAEFCLENKLPDCYHLVGQPIPGRPDRPVATEEMCDAVQVYLNECNIYIEAGNAYVIECKFSLEDIMPDAFGTCDFASYSSKHKELVILDYKHGAGVAVEVENNPQLRYYALGALRALGLKPDQVKRILVGIVQPRCPHPDGSVRQEVLTFEELNNWAMNELIPAATRTRETDAPLSQGSWCRFCPAQAQCPEMAKAAYALAKAEFGATDIRLPSPELLTNEEVAKILAFAPILESYAKEVANFALGQLESGHEIPGFKLVKKKSNREWRDPAEAAKELAKYLNELGYKTDPGGEYDLFVRKDPELKSPAQIEKLSMGQYKKGLKALVENLNTKPDNGNTIAPESDKRPAVPPSAQIEFLADDPIFQ